MSANMCGNNCRTTKAVYTSIVAREGIAYICLQHYFVAMHHWQNNTRIQQPLVSIVEQPTSYSTLWDCKYSASV